MAYMFLLHNLYSEHKQKKFLLCIFQSPVHINDLVEMCTHMCLYVCSDAVLVLCVCIFNFVYFL